MKNLAATAAIALALALAACAPEAVEDFLGYERTPVAGQHGTVCRTNLLGTVVRCTDF
jgi:hypothetical protein